MKARVLVLDSTVTLLELIRPVLQREGFDVQAADRLETVTNGVSGTPAVVIIDACAPFPGGPAGLVRALRSRLPAQILQVSGCHSVDAISRSHPVRADRFLLRPFTAGELLSVVNGMVDSGTSMAPDFHRMYATSERMRQAFQTVRMVAPVDSTVLITGETGTGKEMVARALHAESSVADGPFVAVDCGALPESLLESVLFGHVRGAFTGAQASREGLIMASDGGTLFLDEVANMPPRLQMLLLRVLEERRVRPVGGTRMVEVSIRVIAATSRDLSKEVKLGRFREDLFYRLSVFPIDLPPLREREGDVDRIVRAVLGGPKSGGGEGSPRITPEALDLLRAFTWPGNVRQLLGVLEGARVRSAPGPIDLVHLPDGIVSSVMASEVGELHAALGESRERLSEAEVIRRVLARTGGHRGRAAKLLGFSRTTLWRRIRELAIPVPD